LWSLTELNRFYLRHKKKEKNAAKSRQQESLPLLDSFSFSHSFVLVSDSNFSRTNSADTSFNELDWVLPDKLSAI